MDTQDIIAQLDADAGWEAARLAKAETEHVISQRDSQAAWSAYHQPKLDAFNRISHILNSTDMTLEEKLQKIQEHVQESRRKSAAIEASMKAKDD